LLLRRLGLRAEDFGTEENKARLKAARTAWSGSTVRATLTLSTRPLNLYVPCTSQGAAPAARPPDDEESDDAQEMERYRALRLNCSRRAVGAIWP